MSRKYSQHAPPWIQLQRGHVKYGHADRAGDTRLDTAEQLQGQPGPGGGGIHIRDLLSGCQGLLYLKQKASNDKDKFTALERLDSFLCGGDSCDLGLWSVCMSAIRSA